MLGIEINSSSSAAPGASSLQQPIEVPEHRDVFPVGGHAVHLELD